MLRRFQQKVAVIENHVYDTLQKFSFAGYCAMPSSKLNNLTDSQFEQRVMKATGIVVVDFWAPWCGPCLQMAPGLEAFAEANAGRAQVFKVDADDNPRTAEKFEIRSVPTIIFFKDGEPLFVSRGAMSQASMQKKLDEITGHPHT
jgi:thioredoxin 1